MFRPDWTLRCGEGEMGGFVKDTLYQRRNDDQPQGAAGLSLYRDTVAWGITASPAQKDILDYSYPDQPAAGNRCIHWTGAEQYSAISFAFTPSKDLSAEATAGAAVELWVRCDTPAAQLDLRFVDTRTGTRGDHAWRLGYSLGQGTIPGQGEWKRLELPLVQFTEQGAWEGTRWYAPIGAFDWTAVEWFEIAADYHDLRGIHLYFDNIGISHPGP
jgi:endoglucanase